MPKIDNVFVRRNGEFRDWTKSSVHAVMKQMQKMTSLSNQPNNRHNRRGGEKSRSKKISQVIKKLKIVNSNRNRPSIQRPIPFTAAVSKPCRKNNGEHQRQRSAQLGMPYASGRMAKILVHASVWQSHKQTGISPALIFLHIIKLAFAYIQM